MSFDNLVDSYKDSTKKPAKTYLTTDEVKKKTFSPSTDEETVRILPDSEGKLKIDIAYFHEAKVNGFSQRIPCPKHNEGQHCPFCAKEAELLATQDREGKTKEENDAIFKEAVKYRATKYFIAELLDKGNEKEGKKFWRFKENRKKEGVFDKIVPLYEAFKKKYEGTTPADIQKGADFLITTVDDTLPNGVKYKKVTSIALSDPAPLHSNPKKVEELTTDPTTWRDVFRPTTLPGYNAQKYIEAVLENRVPAWDKEQSAWVVRESETIKVEAKNASLTKNTGTISPADTDDLPF